MIQLSQNDIRWKNLKLGNSDTTFGKSSCFLVSFAMLSDKDPREVHDILLKGGALTDSGNTIETIAAKLLGLEYHGRTKNEPLVIPCIAETDHFKSKKIPQHFFVWLGNGQIIDPIDGKVKDNKYNIVSYRNITPKKMNIKSKYVNYGGNEYFIDSIGEAHIVENQDSANFLRDIFGNSIAVTDIKKSDNNAWRFNINAMRNIDIIVSELKKEGANKYTQGLEDGKKTCKNEIVIEQVEVPKYINKKLSDCTIQELLSEIINRIRLKIKP